MTTDLDEDPIEDWNSGPYCRHFDDPSTCEIVCANCGHSCTDHDIVPSDCWIEGCECQFWEEPEDAS